MRIKIITGRPVRLLGIGLLLGQALLLSACDDNDHAGKYRSIYGIWERQGYGDVLVINRSGADFYQYTRHTCVKEAALDNQELEDLLIDQLQVSKQPPAFSVISPISPAFRAHFKSLTELPDVCQVDQLITRSTPLQVFDHLWHNFNDYYAFFNERGVDWQQQYATYRPLIDEQMTDEALLVVLTDMLAPLNDGHISLNYGTGDFSPEQPTKLQMNLLQAFRQQNEIADFDVFVDQQVSRMNAVLTDYVSDLQVAGGPDDGVTAWGNINQNIAYLRLNRMAAIGREISLDDLEGVTGKDDVTEIKTLMSRVVGDFQDAKAVIIDLRTNGGGFDAVSLEIANYFAHQSSLAVSKYARTYQGRGTEVKAFLKPATDALQVPVVILSSQSTASAAEIFMMTMRAMPNVTVIGEPSNGGLSDTLPKLLPNGWDMTLSNEVYLDYAGFNYEVSGVPVDIEVSAFDLSGFAAGKDSALAAALDYLQTSLP